MKFLRIYCKVKGDYQHRKIDDKLNRKSLELGLTKITLYNSVTFYWSYPYPFFKTYLYGLDSLIILFYIFKDRLSNHYLKNFNIILRNYREVSRYIDKELKPDIFLNSILI